MTDPADPSEPPKPPISPWLLLIDGIVVDAFGALVLVAANAKDDPALAVIGIVLTAVGSLLLLIGAIAGAILVALSYDRWRQSTRSDS